MNKLSLGELNTVCTEWNSSSNIGNHTAEIDRLRRRCMHQQLSIVVGGWMPSKSDSLQNSGTVIWQKIWTHRQSCVYGRQLLSTTIVVQVIEAGPKVMQPTNSSF
jgi:hypothetical protein